MGNSGQAVIVPSKEVGFHLPGSLRVFVHSVVRSCTDPSCHLNDPGILGLPKANQEPSLKLRVGQSHQLYCKKVG